MSEKFSNGLTDAQVERLALLLEECGEVQQAIGKVLRHGYESYDPTCATLSPSNREALCSELGHVRHAIDRLVQAYDINPIEVLGAMKQKSETVQRWLHHQHVEEPR